MNDDGEGLQIPEGPECERVGRLVSVCLESDYKHSWLNKYLS